MKKRRKIFSLLDVSIIVVVTSVVMFLLGATLIYKHLGGVNFSLLDEDVNLQEFIGAYNNLLDNYYDSLDKGKLIDGAIEGMYTIVGDPYTTYLDQYSSDSLNDSLNGRYDGIGITLSKDESGNMTIYSVFDDSPSSRAGLKAGDIIVSINGEDIAGKDASYVANLIQNSSSVSINYLRGTSENTVVVEVESLMVPAVSSMVISSSGVRIGYIRLFVFNDTADIQITNHLSKLESQGIDALILDLRDNSGGYLQIAENIAESFLEKGKVIYSLESKSGNEIAKDDTNEKRTYPIAVVINNNSASAAEILAAALKYSYGATLVGNTSYGKGKVQEKSSLTNGTTIKYTTALWLTPNGDCIDEVGLVPDIEVDMVFDGYDQENITTDIQVMTALKSLVD